MVLEKLDDKAALALRRLTGQTSEHRVRDFDLDNMDEDARDHFFAARYAYDRSMTVPEGYSLESIDDETIALHRPGKSSILGFRGTTTPTDAVTDANLLLKGRASRLDKDLQASAIRIMNERLKDGREYSVAGHSLGGSIAHFVGSKLGLKGHLFNPYIAFGNPEETGAQMTAHIVASDPVSHFYHPEASSNVRYEFYNSPKSNSLTATRLLNAHKLDAFAKATDVNKYIKKHNQRPKRGPETRKQIVLPISAQQAFYNRSLTSGYQTLSAVAGQQKPAKIARLSTIGRDIFQ